MGGDFFPDQPQGVAVGNGRIVIILVDIVAEKCARVVVLTQERRAGQADFDRVAIRLIQIGQETALGIVAAVHFIQKVNALNGDIVIFSGYDVRVVFEFLDIHHGDLRPARMVVDDLRHSDVSTECFTRVNGMHRQAAAGKFSVRLYQ